MEEQDFGFPIGKMGCPVLPIIVEQYVTDHVTHVEDRASDIKNGEKRIVRMRLVCFQIYEVIFVVLRNLQTTKCYRDRFFPPPSWRQVFITRIMYCRLLR